MSYKLKSVFASLPRTQRSVPVVLGEDPKGKNFVYTNGNSVIIRDIENPEICDIYTQHSFPTTVAKYSPNGFYIASGDTSGKIRIWDTTQKEHVLKAEYQPIMGVIKDITWSPDSQRIAIAGEGRERFAHVFFMETGSSVGEILGHSKAVNSIDYRMERPFRIITGSEDCQVNFYEGPPFKFNKSQQEHQRFVNVVRFSKNGALAASGGADGRLICYDGKNLDKCCELGNPAHDGGIYGIAWKADGSQLLSCSGDKTAKLWDVQAQTLISTFVLGHEVEDQQVGCLWQGEHLLTVSLSGFVNYLDVNNPNKPLRILKGHNKSITALAVSEDKQTLFTGSHDGQICYWDKDTGENGRMLGTAHGNQVQEICCETENLVTCSMDDTVRYSNAKTKTFGQLDVKMGSMPMGVKTMASGLTVVACMKEVAVLRSARVVSRLPVSYEASCVAIHPSEREVAVGGIQDHKLHIYTVSGDDQLQLAHEMSHTGAITDVAYNDEGTCLVAADANRRLIPYSVPGYDKRHKYDWGFHSARVNCVRWAPDGVHIASGGVDTGIWIWDIQQPMKTLEIKAAHPLAQVTRLSWLDNDSLVSVGQDSCVRQWHITPP